ncbi:MAG: fused MFS/spermidine synthase [Chloroflexota bacterium]|nr:fused MFS/spermidine synthase [Chloroflexota bacterium]
MREKRADSERGWLLAMVLAAGMTTMAVEMAASRLLQPHFGDSLLVWANLIGLILIYLAVGARLGGRWADRHPDEATLYRITTWAGFLIGLVPFIARPILRLADFGLRDFTASILIGSFLGVVLLFASPMILLGCVPPFALRLTVREVGSSGVTAGRIYALSTGGSILGTFLPSLFLIPWIGTRRTFLLLSIFMLGLSVLALWHTSRRPPLRSLGLLVLILLLAFLWPRGAIRAAPELVYEEESAYNYIQVLREGDERQLKLNEGEGIQSVYRGDQLRTEGAWDYFLAAPFFNPPPFAAEEVRSLCLIGLAGGTVARQYTAAFGPIPIDGVELDPAVINVGWEWFAMTEPNLRAVAQDGRYFLAHTNQCYDIVAVDAYRAPYIPFHLTTREFFALVRDHLTERGAMAINVGRTDVDYRLVAALATTMQQVFPSVYLINVPQTFNSLLIATVQPTKMANLRANLQAVEAPFLRGALERAAANLHPLPSEGGLILADDRAPIEQMTHSLLLRYWLKGD